MAGVESSPTLSLRPQRKRTRSQTLYEPVLPPKPKKKKRNSSKPTHRLKDILKKLMNSPSSQPFLSPPNPIDFPDYAQRVNHIDLSMVLENLNDGLYKENDARFVSDVKQIWSNAIVYFPATSIRHQLAQASQKDFQIHLENAEREKNPMKMMESRIAAMEKQMKEILSRLDRNEKRRLRPPTVQELQRLANDIKSLPDCHRRGMMDIAPKQFIETGNASCEINLENLGREEFESLRKYIRECKGKKKKKGKSQSSQAETTSQAESTSQNTMDGFLKSVKKGEAEIMQARADKIVELSDSSSSSSDSDSEREDTQAGADR